MTIAAMPLTEYLRQAELDLDDDWLRQMVEQFTQGLIEMEAEQKIGAARHERSPNRLTQCIGGFFPSLLGPRRRAEKALVAVVQEAYMEGVSTCKVDDLLVALGKFTPAAIMIARGRSNLRLIDGEELVELILEHYEQFDPSYKAILPLKRVYAPALLSEAAV